MSRVYILRRITALLVVALIALAISTLAKGDGGSVRRAPPKREPVTSLGKHRDTTAETTQFQCEADRVAFVIETDAALAKDLVKMIYNLKPNVDSQTAYELALDTAAYSRRYEIRPHLMIAVAFHESEFDPGCTSRTNDFGIYQNHNQPWCQDDIRKSTYEFSVEYNSWRETREAGERRSERETLARYNGGGRPPGISYQYADAVLEIAK